MRSRLETTAQIARTASGGYMLANRGREDLRIGRGEWLTWVAGPDYALALDLTGVPLASATGRVSIAPGDTLRLQLSPAASSACYPYRASVLIGGREQEVRGGEEGGDECPGPEGMDNRPKIIVN